jgi:predicted DNA-binding transcriptional regulator AlpA
MLKHQHAVTAGPVTSRGITTNFDALPDSAFIREAQLVQSPKRPDSLAPLPFSAPTLWRKVKAGSFPKPHRLSERVTAWKVGDVRAWINQHTANA